MKNWMSALLVFALVWAVAPAARARDACSDVIEISSGKLSGKANKETDTCRYLGIPYAAPPVDDMRWKAPAPGASWSGVLEADKFQARCMQKGEMELVNADPSGRMSEDCLYLNVWRPAKSGSFPVMVWIHGGGLKGGTANSPMYWGDRLADRGDVVVVSINYRLNVFGYYAHPALREEDPNNSTGNYGLLDQIAALEWVRENIEAFGGDPDRVTIFGESAGGWSVCYLLASPLAKGLFHGAIIESGGCQTVHALDEDYPTSLALARELGCAEDDLDCLRGVSAKKLMKKGVGGMTGGFKLVANIDGYALEDSPLEVIRSGDYNNVPLIAGFNRVEIKPLLILFPKLKKAKPSEYVDSIADFAAVSRGQAEDIADLYPLDDYENSPRSAFEVMGSHMVLGCPTWSGMAAAAEHQDKVYLYRFDYDDMVLGKTIGAMHAMELPFVFDSRDRRPTNLLYDFRKMGPSQDLVDAMQGYWINFAKTGDPNGPGLPEWPAFDDDAPRAMILDTASGAASLDIKERCDYWEEYNEKATPMWETLGKHE